MSTILSWSEAARLAEDCRKRAGIVVTSNGTFDLLHVGHVSYLAAARSLGDLLLVGVNSDRSVKAYKGPERPLNPENARAQVLGALRCVDGVCIFDEDTPVEWLKVVKPDIHVKGGDWDPAKIPEAKVLEAWGGRIHIIPTREGYSTTRIIERSRGK